METKQNASFSFEQAYARLEGILSELNSGETPLEESLKLYEEANKLMTLCSSKLNQAEQKIETLIKTRDAQPQTAPFNPESEKVLDTAHDTYS